MSKAICVGSGSCNRMSAWNVLKDKINRQETHLNALKELLIVIDWDKLTIKQDELLYDFFIKRKSTF